MLTIDEIRFLNVPKLYKMKTLRVQSTAYPNGDYKKYSNGMPVPEILPSNHPIVLAMRYQRAENEFKGSKSALRQAKRILGGRAWR